MQVQSFDRLLEIPLAAELVHDPSSATLIVRGEGVRFMDRSMMAGWTLNGACAHWYLQNETFRSNRVKGLPGDSWLWIDWYRIVGEGENYGSILGKFIYLPAGSEKTLVFPKDFENTGHGKVVIRLQNPIGEVVAFRCTSGAPYGRFRFDSVVSTLTAADMFPGAYTYHLTHPAICTDLLSPIELEILPGENTYLTYDLAEQGCVLRIKLDAQALEADEWILDTPKGRATMLNGYKHNKLAAPKEIVFAGLPAGDCAFLAGGCERIAIPEGASEHTHTLTRTPVELSVKLSNASGNPINGSLNAYLLPRDKHLQHEDYCIRTSVNVKDGRLKLRGPVRCIDRERSLYPGRYWLLLCDQGVSTGFIPVDLSRSGVIDATLSTGSGTVDIYSRAGHFEILGKDSQRYTFTLPTLHDCFGYVRVSLPEDGAWRARGLAPHWLRDAAGFDPDALPAMELQLNAERTAKCYLFDLAQVSDQMPVLSLVGMPSKECIRVEITRDDGLQIPVRTYGELKNARTNIELLEPSGRRVSLDVQLPPGSYSVELSSPLIESMSFEIEVPSRAGARVEKLLKLRPVKELILE